MQIVGIDGCAAGWVAATANRIAVFPNVASAINAFPKASRILIDMPMGLPLVGPRDVEIKARACLPKGKASSVFAIPCRAAITAPDFQSACQANLETQGKKFSIQTWNICKKINELDQLLQRTPSLTKRLYESHPELAFARLAGNVALPKKRTPEGFAIRLELLARHIVDVAPLVEQTLMSTRRADLARDDILDALVLMVTGSIANELIVDSMVRDEQGIPIRMLVPERC